MSSQRNLHHDRHSSNGNTSHRRSSSLSRGRFNTFTTAFLVFATMAIIFNSNHNFQSLYDDGAANAMQQLMESSGKLDAIVTVAMCGFHANDMVKALRNEGKWTNPIYVITDTPEAEDDTLCTPINVKGNHPTFLNQEEYEAYQRGARQFNPEIWSKWHKTQLFQLLPETVNTLLFLDADMLAQKPLSKDWLPEVAPLIADQECDLILNPERWYTKIPILGRHSRNLTGRYNSGMVIQKRTQSHAVNEKWSSLLVHEPFMGRDQGKLTEAIDETETQICFLPNRWNHVQNQADIMDRIWFHKYFIFGANKGTFLHLASSKKGEWKTRLKTSCDLSTFPDLNQQN